jgi:hypothetical protein
MISLPISYSQVNVYLSFSNLMTVDIYKFSSRVRIIFSNTFNSMFFYVDFHIHGFVNRLSLTSEISSTYKMPVERYMLSLNNLVSMFWDISENFGIFYIMFCLTPLLTFHLSDLKKRYE